MLTKEGLNALDKEHLGEFSKQLTEADISQLVEWLALKDDDIRYKAFLIIQSRSEMYNDIYPYWDVFAAKLKSENSYQRSLGLMLIAANVKWDSKHLFDNIVKDYLALLNDEKPITVRQCIQSLSNIVTNRPDLSSLIADKLISTNLMSIKETMRKVVLQDIINVLLQIRKSTGSSEADSFILGALSGEILDSKFKKQLKALL